MTAHGVLLFYWQSWGFFLVVHKIKVCHTINGFLELMKYPVFR